MQHIQTEDLSAYIDGVVDDRLRSAIEGHLATCAECRAEFAELRATVRLLNALPALAQGRSFQLGPEHRKAKPPQSPVMTLLPVVRALSVAAAIALLVVSGAFLFDAQDAGNRDDNIVSSETTYDTSARSGETDSRAGSSESAEDAANSSSATSGDQGGESQQQQQGGLIDRGNAAAATDGPMAEAPAAPDSQPAESAAAESVPPEGADAISRNPSAASGVTSGSAAATAEERTIPWGTIALWLGAATIVLTGLWIALTRIARSVVRTGT